MKTPNSFRMTGYALALLLPSLCPPVQAVSGKAGAFAPLPVGARGAALAGAQVAAPEASEALILNPAGMTQVEFWNAGYHHASAYGIIPYHQVDGVYHLQGKSVWLGATWKENGDEIYAENEVRLGGAYRRGFISVGGAWNLRHAGTGAGGSDFRDPETGLNHRVDATGLGFLGFDVGAIARPFGDRYALGLAFHDLFSRISWDSENEANTAAGEYAQYVPVTMRLGFYAHPDQALAFFCDFEPSLYHDGISRLASGLEILPMEWLPDSQIKEWLRDCLATRIGYARNMFTDDAFHRLTAGTGLRLHHAGLTLQADMAYDWVFAFESRNTLRFGFHLGK